ncbi:MAG: YaiO family outer membrane beta-barrel protein [Bacteroidia bacterium]|nr:YaiO family outer membrane beta-barrel protein [Bacteroidia bacterium]
MIILEYKSICIKISILFLSIVGISKTFSQIENVNSSFQVARTLAFSSKYNESILLCKKILEKNPSYQDVQVLLGRVYFWNNQPDSAILVLSESINSNPYQDAFVALSDIHRWNSKLLDALKTAEDGLKFFPSSEELFIRKIKALLELKDFNDAYPIIDSLIAKNKKNSELRQLSESIKMKRSKNIFSISYDFDYFDKQFNDPWHTISTSYARQTRYLGRLITRANFGNRFASNGYQIEIDAYPALGKKMYAYINAGYSPSIIFPNYRSGISVYRNFPRAFEGELGFRVLYFSKATILYVGSIGKYTGNFWFSARQTLIAFDSGKKVSPTYSFITRYYGKTTYDYITLTLGYGLTPDDRVRELLLENVTVKNYIMKLSVQKLFRGNNIFSINSGIVRGEYIHGDYFLNGKKTGNNIFAGINFQKIF